ncbi:unnamed protein product [Adineta steineri]|uniref:Tetraspanin n=1 Tax=Adineta steineri TaxID=433720 RepID=A0A814U8M0_9BILA|nr:unnamed protein product [Adineta steineri]CAF3493106.1 unnamed protein product [Adineta steineri]
MVCCINVVCFFCTICVFIGLASLIQFCLGIYLTFLQTDIIIINRLVKTDEFDSYLFYILLVFIGLGLISLILSFFSIYSIIRKLKSLSLFISVLWIFAAALNIVMFVVSLLYYFVILPQLRLLLIRTLQQTSLLTAQLLEPFQSKNICCGINGRDDYYKTSLDEKPPSCCRVPNCWTDTDINNHIDGLNSTVSLMHTQGCYSMINKYVTFELWTLVGISGICALLQLLAIMFMCTLYQRYKKLDDDPKFVIDHLANEIPINNNNKTVQGSSQTIEETVEITQI